MEQEISEFFYSFKNKIVEAKDLVENHSKTINEFYKKIVDLNYDKKYEENFLTILGYSYRLDDINQRVFFTFQEAVYAIDLDKLMRNEDSMRLNSIVYILVLNRLIKEFNGEIISEELKQKAIQTYKVIEDRRSKENKKYHMYQ